MTEQMLRIANDVEFTNALGQPMTILAGDLRLDTPILLVSHKSTLQAAPEYSRDIALAHRAGLDQSESRAGGSLASALKA
jgi:hypothetical protein